MVHVPPKSHPHFPPGSPSRVPSPIQAWCESCHTKDTATALSLLVGRSADVRKWSQSQLPPNTSRRRSMELLVGTRTGWDDRCADVACMLHHVA